MNVQADTLPYPPSYAHRHPFLWRTYSLFSISVVAFQVPDYNITLLSLQNLFCPSIEFFLRRELWRHNFEVFNLIAPYGVCNGCENTKYSSHVHFIPFLTSLSNSIAPLLSTLLSPRLHEALELSPQSTKGETLELRKTMWGDAAHTSSIASIMACPKCYFRASDFLAESGETKRVASYSPI